MATDRLNNIKKQVVEENYMEPPEPSEMKGMRPSIVSSKNAHMEKPSKEDMGTQESQERSYDESNPEEGNTESYEAPQPMTSQPMPSGRVDVETFQEIAESIINEKWQELVSSMGNIAIWKEKVHTDILSIKQELVRVEDRFENLQRAILGRVEDYHKTISDVSVDIKALEQVFEKILQPLTTNIKELNRITDDLKGKKK